MTDADDALLVLVNHLTLIRSRLDAHAGRLNGLQDAITEDARTLRLLAKALNDELRSRVEGG